MIAAERINAYYGPSHILFDVSFAMGAQDRVAVVGRNGAGKSTLLKSLMNAGPQVRGKVSWHGEALDSMPAYRRARLGLQLVPEDRRIFHHLTLRENIRIAEHARGSGVERIPPDEVIDQFPMLQPLRERMGYQLSGGQQQVLAIARAFAARPKLMLLDEPTEGVAPAIVEGMVETIRNVCAGNAMGLLLCEQNLWFARQVTDRVVVMDTGRIVFDGSWAEFSARPDVKKAHLAI
ncbi:MAG: ABC transporter ATP-binding protein [Rhizobiaceae bacterium]|nr:ABC transporter ATP-binding protein [Rhizobiaceae bacterium]